MTPVQEDPPYNRKNNNHPIKLLVHFGTIFLYPRHFIILATYFANFFFS